MALPAPESPVSQTVNPGAGSARVTVGEYILGSAILFGMKRRSERRADPYRDTQVIDERAPRTNQAVVGVVALVAVVTGWWLLLALLALQLALGLTLGRRWCLACVFYYEVLQPRFGEGPLEDSRPPRFANMVGLGFLGAASLAYLAGWTTLGAVLGGIVAALALLAAVTGFCAGCNAYKLGYALTGRRFVSCPLPRARRAERLVLGEAPVEHDAPAVGVGDRDAAAVPVGVLRLDVGVAEVGEPARRRSRRPAPTRGRGRAGCRRSAPGTGCRRRGR